jgi:acyl carrier protein
MVFEKVKKIINEVISIDEEKITLEANLENDLGADSLDAVEIIMLLEDEFDISLDDEATQNIKTVSDLVKFIEEKRN